MPRNGKLKSIERDYDEQCETLIPRLLMALGTPYRVAVQLGVYPYTIRNWLTNNGYQFVDGSWCYIAAEAECESAIGGEHSHQHSSKGES